MKNFAMFIACGILMLVGVQNLNAAVFNVRDFNIYSNSSENYYGGNQPGDASIFTDNSGCVSSIAGSNCDRIFYTNSSVAQNLMDDVDAIYADFRNESSATQPWVDNQMWSVAKADDEYDCWWSISAPWTYFMNWYLPSSTPNRGSSFSNIMITSDVENENYFYQCALSRGHTYTTRVYPILEVRYQYVGGGTWYGKQFGVYLSYVP